METLGPAGSETSILKISNTEEKKKIGFKEEEKIRKNENFETFENSVDDPKVLTLMETLGLAGSETSIRILKISNTEKKSNIF